MALHLLEDQIIECVYFSFMYLLCGSCFRNVYLQARKLCMNPNPKVSHLILRLTGAHKIARTLPTIGYSYNIYVCLFPWSFVVCLYFPGVPLRNFNMSLVFFYFQDLSKHYGLYSETRTGSLFLVVYSGQNNRFTYFVVSVSKDFFLILKNYKKMQKRKYIFTLKHAPVFRIRY